MGFRLHDLRRTLATITKHHLEQKVSGETIKRLLNHSNGDVRVAALDARTLLHPVDYVP